MVSLNRIIYYSLIMIIILVKRKVNEWLKYDLLASSSLSFSLFLLLSSDVIMMIIELQFFF